MKMRTVLGWLCLAAWAPASHAQLVPGDLLTTERSAGTVVNLRGGGDFTSSPRFATGLADPAGLCLGPGGELYVSEAATGEVTLITTGGDFSAAPPFAFGLDQPHGLACTDSQVLVFDASAGEIFDITSGGDFSAAVPFALVDLFNDGSLFGDSAGTLWVASFTWIHDLTAGGDVRGLDGYAELDGNWAGLGEWNGMLLGGSPGGGTIVDFTAGGEVTSNVFATFGSTPSGLLGVPGLGLFVHTDDLVLEVSAGGDQTAAPPFASGLDTSTFGQLVYVAGCGDGILDPATEECDDGNPLNGDTCDAMCMIGVPEPTHVLLLVTGALVLAGTRRLMARGAVQPAPGSWRPLRGNEP